MDHKVRFEWELPESLLGLIAQDEAKVAEEVKRAAVLEWVRMKKISWRKGAELLGMTYRDFLSLRGRDAGYPAPPAQTRTCSIPASGSSVALASAQAETITGPPPVCCSPQ